MHPARLLFLFSCCLVIGGCTPVPAQTSSPTPSATLPPTRTLAPTLTSTPLPTVTATPAPSATPLGGGGKLLFTGYRSMFGGEFASAPGDFNVYAANPDGSQLSLLTRGPEVTNNFLAGASPDGQKVLYYSTTNPTSKIYLNDNRVDLWVTGLSGEGSIRLNPEDVHSFVSGAAWGPDGNVYFAGWDQEGVGLFRVGPDGSGLSRVAKPATLTIVGQAKIMFLDPDKKGFYWVTGAVCENALCGAKYYWTALDGSDQQQVWKWLKGTTDRIALSPDGKWLAYQFFLSRQIPESYKNGCYVAATDGSVVQQMPGKYTSCYSISHQTDFWSPDGQSFVYDTMDQELEKYPLHSFSPAQKITTDLPDVQVPGCWNPHWLPDANRIFFSYCQSNFMGYSMVTSSRMVDLSTGDVTTYPGANFCETSFSPDGRSIFLYNCHSQADGQRDYSFYTLDLETATLTPLFTDVLNASQKDSYWIDYSPVPWEAWSH